MYRADWELPFPVSEEGVADTARGSWGALRGWSGSRAGGSWSSRWRVACVCACACACPCVHRHPRPSSVRWAAEDQWAHPARRACFLYSSPWKQTRGLLGESAAARAGAGKAQGEMRTSYRITDSKRGSKVLGVWQGSQHGRLPSAKPGRSGHQKRYW